MLTHVMSGEELPEECAATLFLAGPTPRDAHTAPWRPAALDQLRAARFEGVVLDPERRDGWAGDYDDQVGWETTALAAADVIAFWVPRDLKDMPAFTTNVEFGMRARSGRVVFGSPPDAPKNRYLRWWCERLGVPTFDTLDATLDAALDALAGAAPRRDAERFVPHTLWASPSFQGWLDAQRDAGHDLEAIDVQHLHPATTGAAPFLWVAHPKVRVAGEGRCKGNEVVVGRPDVCAVAAHGPLSGDDTEVVFVAEYRSAGLQPGGRVVELPGGSADTSADMAAVAAAELGEETGLWVQRARLEHVSTRQVASTLVAHRAHLYRVQLTGGELDELRARAARGPLGALVDDAEVTWVQVRTVADLERSGQGDWATLGQVRAALAAAEVG